MFALRPIGLVSAAAALLTAAILIPGAGFDDLYAPIRGNANTLVAGFANLALTY